VDVPQVVVWVEFGNRLGSELELAEVSLENWDDDIRSLV